MTFWKPLAAVFCCMLVSTLPVVAQVVENGDAGDLPLTAQVAAGAGGLTTISGELDFGNVDMYEIAVNGGGTFSAFAHGNPPLYLDAQLYLFDANGRGVYANDNESPPSVFVGAARLPANHPLTPVQPGRYYLAISTRYKEPVNAVGPIFPCVGCNTSAVVGPTGAGGAYRVTGWSGMPFTAGTYSISLTGAEFVSRVYVTANDTNGPLRLGSGDSLRIKLHFNAMNVGLFNPAEMYVAIAAPFGLRWVTPTGLSTTPTPVYTGPLPTFGPLSIVNLLDVSVLPTGTYRWWMIVDDDSNGTADGDFVDVVQTTIVN